VFYEKLNSVLEASGFDRFVEELCAPHYAETDGRPSIPDDAFFHFPPDSRHYHLVEWSAPNSL